MSQTGVVSWSQTAATNAAADSTVNMAEGMAPSAVNDGMRALMASAAKYRDDTAGSLLTGGTSTAYTLTSNQDFSSLSVLNGQELKVRFHTANGASPTLSVDSQTAAPIQVDASNAVGTGAIIENSIWSVTYDNSIPAFILNGAATVQTGGIANSAVTTAKIAAGAVATANLADTAVTTAKITDANVTYAKMQNVTNGKVLGNFSGSGAAPSEYSLGNNLAVSSTTLDTKYGPKAWVTFTLSGTTVTIQKSFNITSVVRISTGRFTITFINAMTDAYYVPTCLVQGVGGDSLFGAIHFGTTPGTSSFVLDIITGSGSDIDPAQVSVAVFGN